MALPFETAVTSIKRISACFQRGLKALGGNSSKVQAASARKLEGSVDLDGCLKQSHPNDSRWDFAIGYDSEAVFVEIHPAQTSEVSAILAKLDWLQNWLSGPGQPLRALARQNPFFWLSTDGVDISKGSPQSRRLAESGLVGPLKILLL